MTTTAPGWHQDPSTPAQVRYWDGTRLDDVHGDHIANTVV